MTKFYDVSKEPNLFNTDICDKQDKGNINNKLNEVSFIVDNLANKIYDLAGGNFEKKIIVKRFKSIQKKREKAKNLVDIFNDNAKRKKTLGPYFRNQNSIDNQMKIIKKILIDDEVAKMDYIRRKKRHDTILKTLDRNYFNGKNLNIKKNSKDNFSVDANFNDQNLFSYTSIEKSLNKNETLKSNFVNVEKNIINDTKNNQGIFGFYKNFELENDKNDNNPKGKFYNSTSLININNFQNNSNSKSIINSSENVDQNEKLWSDYNNSSLFNYKLQKTDIIDNRRKSLFNLNNNFSSKFINNNRKEKIEDKNINNNYSTTVKNDKAYNYNSFRNSAYIPNIKNFILNDKLNNENETSKLNSVFDFEKQEGKDIIKEVSNKNKLFTKGKFKSYNDIISQEKQQSIKNVLNLQPINSNGLIDIKKTKERSSYLLSQINISDSEYKIFFDTPKNDTIKNKGRINKFYSSEQNFNKYKANKRLKINDVSLDMNKDPLNVEQKLQFSNTNSNNFFIQPTTEKDINEIKNSDNDKFSILENDTISQCEINSPKKILNTKADYSDFYKFKNNKIIIKNKKNIQNTSTIQQNFTQTNPSLNKNNDLTSISFSKNFFKNFSNKKKKEVEKQLIKACLTTSQRSLGIKKKLEHSLPIRNKISKLRKEIGNKHLMSTLDKEIEKVHQLYRDSNNFFTNSNSNNNNFNPICMTDKKADVLRESIYVDKLNELNAFEIRNLIFNKYRVYVGEDDIYGYSPDVKRELNHFDYAKEYKDKQIKNNSFKMTKMLINTNIKNKELKEMFSKSKKESKRTVEQKPNINEINIDEKQRNKDTKNLVNENKINFKNQSHNDMENVLSGKKIKKDYYFKTNAKI